MVARVVIVIAAVCASASAVTPVQKVVLMMNEMKAKGEEEKKSEEVTFAAFAQWCQHTDRQKAESIREGKATMAKLAAAIEKYDSDAKVLGEEVTKLGSLANLASNDKAAANKMREEEHATYLKTHDDLVSSVDAMSKGIDTVKRMMASSPSLVQKAVERVQVAASKPNLPSSARRVLAAFLATRISSADSLFKGIDVTAPEASTFESQSGGIVGMMGDLQDKLQDETAKCEGEETNARQQYEMMAQSLTDQIEGHMSVRSRKVSTKKGKEAASAEARGDLAETTVAKKADEKYLADLQSSCSQKTRDFELRQKLRAEELEAVDKAIEILSSDDVSGAADRNLPGFIQASKPALAQLRNSVTIPSQSAAAAYLEMQSRKLKSHMLAALSVRVTEDPFTKIKKMIKDMVIKLTEEATDEAEHKGWCDTELATNLQTRDSKSSDVDELTASIEEKTAQTAKLAMEVTKLSQELAELDSSVAEATNIRQQEKDKNAAALSDAKGAIVAVEKATVVLKDFYAKAAGATALQQMSRGVSDDAPETFDKPYTGMAGGGVLGMLEVILSDFQRVEVETTQNEAASQAEYESFMNDSAEDKAVKGQMVKNKNNMKTKVESQTSEAKNDLASAQEELDAAMAYFSKLKPSCVDAGVSYEERVGNRKEEIQSLQEALKILAGEDI